MGVSRAILRGILGDFGSDWGTELTFVFKEERMNVNWINGA
jgi:hypothetical protein